MTLPRMVVAALSLISYACRARLSTERRIGAVFAGARLKAACDTVLKTGFLMVLQIACGRGSPHANAQLESGALARSNVLLITIDTLRADRVGAYSGGPLTPALDALAARGIRFTQAHAHVPLTLPAHTSILTGLVPATHGVHNNGAAGVAPAVPTLASILHDAGYRTGAFVGAFVLDARFGLSRGFETYDDRVGSDTGPITFAFAERTADRVAQLAGDWILERARPEPFHSPLIQSLSTDERLAQDVPAEGRPRPFFCWIHLFDPHAPYRAPEQRAADPYDNEVAFADAQLARLFDRLRAAGQLDRTLIVALADHGESLGDHGEATHGLFAYDATLRIPLIVAGPAIHAATCDAAAAQADVLPTVLDLLGIQPPSRIDGQSLLRAIRGDPTAARPVYFEALDAYLTRNWAPLTGIVADGWKYIDLPDPELYDLTHDPGELHNRMGGERERAETLRRRLAEWPPPSVARTTPRPAPIDPDAAARLRALGYTAAQATDAGRTRFTSADDPKRLIDLDRRYERALTLTGERRYGEAAALLQSAIADRPDFVVAYLNLASVYIAGGDPHRAVTLLEDAAKHGVTTPELRARLGTAYLASGDLTRAANTLEPVADSSRPGGLDALNTLGIVFTQLGRHDRARASFAEVLRHSPRSATTWSNLGLLELADHRPADAVRAFEAAVGADPQLTQAWQGLGAARARSNPSGAIEAWRRALELEPANYDLLFNVATLLREQGRSAEARPYVERFVREAPPDRYAHDIATLRGWLAK
jgi:arylsulfatase A-like enzyme/Tfp pilus assembly protein PilF